MGVDQALLTSLSAIFHTKTDAKMRRSRPSCTLPCAHSLLIIVTDRPDIRFARVMYTHNLDIDDRAELSLGPLVLRTVLETLRSAVLIERDAKGELIVKFA